MNNEMLAAVWQDDIRQIIVVWPLIWKHHPGGNWCVSLDLSKTCKQNMDDVTAGAKGIL